MAKPKKTEVDQRLLDSWTPPEAAGEPLGCVGTTFTFEPAFFEEHCSHGSFGWKPIRAKTALLILLSGRKNSRRLDHSF
jgi:hypothetical protein